MIKLTREVWKKILNINRTWNDKIEYESDSEHYGKKEWWAFPEDGLGDCEDYAIAKRQALASFDIPSYFATCWTDQGYHAVLLVDTDLGTYVLSNGIDNVLNYSHFDWQWDKRECEDGTWRKISG